MSPSRTKWSLKSAKGVERVEFDALVSAWQEPPPAMSAEPPVGVCDRKQANAHSGLIERHNRSRSGQLLWADPMSL